MPPRENLRRSRAVAERAARLVGNYRPLPGVSDELIGRDGRIRPHWQRFVQTMAELGGRELQHRFSLADRHLAESGVDGAVRRALDKLSDVTCHGSAPLAFRVQGVTPQGDASVETPAAEPRPRCFCRYPSFGDLPSNASAENERVEFVSNLRVLSQKLRECARVSAPVGGARE